MVERREIACVQDVEVPILLTLDSTLVASSSQPPPPLPPPPPPRTPQHQISHHDPQLDVSHTADLGHRHWTPKMDFPKFDGNGVRV